MIWLEMISVRTGTPVVAEQALDFCREVSKSVQTGELLKFAVYCNGTYPTDVSIHLLWKSNPGQSSMLGREVCTALGDLGLVSHTLWIEQKESGVVNGLEFYSRRVA